MRPWTITLPRKSKSLTPTTRAQRSLRPNFGTKPRTLQVVSNSNSGSSDLAYIVYSVMKDGIIASPDTDVNGYIRDSVGNWVQNHD